MDPKFIINLKGKDHPLWAGILAEAHERGLQSIETQLLQIPAEENGHTAIVKATAAMKDGTRFDGIGDANPKNVGEKIVNAIIRMAETRAKGRALRDACNIGQTMLEELGDLEEHRQESRGDRYPQEKWGAKPAPIAGAAAAAKQERPLVRHEPGTVEGDVAMSQAKLVCSEEGCGMMLRPAQVTASEHRFGRRLCPAHQESAAGQ